MICKTGSVAHMLPNQKKQINQREVATNQLETMVKKSTACKLVKRLLHLEFTHIVWLNEKCSNVFVDSMK